MKKYIKWVRKLNEKYNIILDTDIGNSWDDQFALAYLLKNEILNISRFLISEIVNSITILCMNKVFNKFVCRRLFERLTK